MDKNDHDPRYSSSWIMMLMTGLLIVEALDIGTARI